MHTDNPTSMIHLSSIKYKTKRLNPSLTISIVELQNEHNALNYKHRTLHNTHPQIYTHAHRVEPWSHAGIWIATRSSAGGLLLTHRLTRYDDTMTGGDEWSESVMDR